jgi:hypothetical protein
MLSSLLLCLLQIQTPTLDGTIAAGEWDHAIHLTGTANLDIYLLDSAADSAVYMAVRGRGDGYPHIAVSRRDTVLILHASAALGTAEFAGSGTRKRLVQEFNFRVRSPSLTGEAITERESFYREDGWAASTIRMGQPGETEFMISRRLLGTASRIVVAYWSEADGVSHWPAEVDDASVELRMVQGFLPQEARFAVAQWAAILTSVDAH